MQKTHHKSDFLTLQTFTNFYKRYEGDKFEKHQRTKYMLAKPNAQQAHAL